MSDPEFIPPGKQTFVLGLDLGQAQDWTALAVNQLVERPDGNLEHRTRHLQRWRGEKYPAIVRTVCELVSTLRGPEDRRPIYVQRSYPLHRPRVVMIVDYTGVGRPVVDMIEEARPDCELVPVTITGGSAITHPEGTNEYHVPKRILASQLQVLLQTERLKVQEELDLTDTLTKEMKNFRVKINLLGHESYGAGADWREGNHDDLVLAEALACWAAEAGIATGGWLEDVDYGAFFRNAGISLVNI